MTETRILVVDDDADWAKTMRDAIKNAVAKDEGAKATPLWGEDLKKEIKILLARQLALRENPRTRKQFEDSVFDKLDVLVIDYDLAQLFGAEAPMTGELLASLVRRYSFCGPIVSVNRYGQQRFNLRLSGDASPWADLSISHGDLEDTGLWTHSWQEYRPWSWPVLLDLPEVYSKRVDFCTVNFDRKIGHALQIPRTLLEVFPKQALGSHEDLLDLTFGQLVRKHLLPPRDRKLPKRYVTRMVASSIGKWLEGTVLSGQDILIDPPHLASMFPSLITLTKKSKRSLDRLASLKRDQDLPIDTELLSGAEFELGFWLSRSAWWTDLVLANSRIAEVLEPWKPRKLKFAFAEDTSQFHLLEELVEFGAEGLFVSRWIRRPKDEIPYEPSARLAL